MEELTTKTTTEEQVEETQVSDNRVKDVKFIKKVFRFCNLATLNVALVISFILICVSYLIVSNQLVSRGFVINDVKINFEELEKENRASELLVMNLESYSYISEKVVELGMVGVGEVEYVEAVNKNVAMR